MGRVCGTAQRSFLAVDFETANSNRYSACSVGLVLVENGKITMNEHYLIRPPEDHFDRRCVDIHGIGLRHVEDAGEFPEVWREVKYLFKYAEFLSAHNAGFDRSVLHSTLDWYGLKAPAQPFTCTMRLARDHWGYPSAGLPDVCRHQRIALPKHHDALEDAWACARLTVKGLRSGWSPTYLA